MASHPGNWPVSAGESVPVEPVRDGDPGRVGSLTTSAGPATSPSDPSELPVSAEPDGAREGVSDERPTAKAATSDAVATIDTAAVTPLIERLFPLPFGSRRLTPETDPAGGGTSAAGVFGGTCLTP